MTREEAAALLDGCEFGQPLPPSSVEALRQDRLVAAYVDDLGAHVLAGALEHETAGGRVYFDETGRPLVSGCSDPLCPNLDGSGLRSISFGSTLSGGDEGVARSGDIPYATFRMLTKYGWVGSTGIVFNLADCAPGPRDRRITFTKLMFSDKMGRKRQERKDQYWRDLCYIAGVAPEDVDDVKAVTIEVGRVEVERKVVAVVGGEDLISEMEAGNVQAD